MTLGAIEVQSTNAAERLFSIICLTFGLLFGSSLISSLSAAMVDFREMQRERNEKLRLLRRYLRENKVAARLAINVQKQVTERMGRREKLHDSDVDAIQLLSMALRVQLRFDICGPSIMRNPLMRLFFSLDADIGKQICMRAVSMILLQPKDHLFAAGDMSIGVYYLKNGALSYDQDPDSSPVAEKLRTEVKPNVWLSEATLWTEWVHVGTAEADVHCEAIGLDVETFMELVRRHLVIRQICKEYCEQFNKRLAAASPPDAVWPNDLEVPYTDYADLVVHMGKEVQVIVGLDAVKLLNQTRRSRNRFAELKDEIRKGKSVVVVNSAGEVKRIVSVVLLKITDTSGQVLMQLGSRQGREILAHVQLPGTKCRRRELTSDSVRRILTVKLHSLAQCVSKVSSVTREIEEKESLQHGLPTRYLRTICSARLCRATRIRGCSCRMTYRRMATERASAKSMRSAETVQTMHSEVINNKGTSAVLFSHDQLGRIQDNYEVFGITSQDGRRDYYAWISPSDLELLIAPTGKALVQAWLNDLEDEEVRDSVGEGSAPEAAEGAEDGSGYSSTASSDDSDSPQHALDELGVQEEGEAEPWQGNPSEGEPASPASASHNVSL